MKLFIKPIKEVCFSINTECLTTIGETEIIISINNAKFKLKVYVFENIEDNILLGSDFLSLSSAKIDYKNEMMEIYPKDNLISNNSTSINHNKVIKFLSKNSIKLPPKTQKFIDIIPNNKIDKICEIIPSTKLYYKHNIISANSLYFPNDTKSHRILVANDTEFIQNIAKNQVVGIEYVDNSDFYIQSKITFKQKSTKKLAQIPYKFKKLEFKQNNIVLNRKQKLIEKIIEIKDKNQTNTSDRISFKINDDLNDNQKINLNNLLTEYENIFSKHSLDLGYCNIVKHEIKTSGRPINIPNYKLSQIEKEYIRNEVQKFIDCGIVVESSSPYNSPVLLCPKPDGVRLVLDYRKLNSITESDLFPIPPVKNVLSALSGNKYFAKIDLTSGFFQVALDKHSQPKTAFSTDIGHYEFVVLAQGLKNSPSCFSRTINTVLAGLEWNILVSYVDDCIVFANTFENFIERLRIVFDRFKKYNLKLKANKCEFGMNEIKFLGFKINEIGIALDEKKIESIVKMPEPQNIKELQSFLGCINFNRDQ